MVEAFKYVSMPPEEFIGEAINIVDLAERKGIRLRILGACAVYIHSQHVPGAIDIYRALGRFTGSNALFTDLDLIAYSKQRGDIMRFFEKELGFKYDLLIRALFAGKRLVYFHPRNLYHVDVFFDVLEFNHDIFFGKEPGKGRLELDYPTISLADIVLEKLQITKINYKDLVDLAVLLYAHEVCESSDDKECVDAGYIAGVLARDWGFWYDATSNLDKLVKFIVRKRDEGLLSQEHVDRISSRVSKLLEVIERTPKTDAWIKRSKIGTSKPWYREVEELIR